MYKLMGVALLAYGALVGALVGTSQAQELDDPTRPTSTVAPAATVQPSPNGPASLPRFNPDAYRLTTTYVLGSIQRARINGDWFEPGARLRDGVITEIKAHQITVATAERHYVLKTPAARATFSRIEETP